MWPRREALPMPILLVLSVVVLLCLPISPQGDCADATSADPFIRGFREAGVQVRAVAAPYSGPSDVRVVWRLPIAVSLRNVVDGMSRRERVLRKLEETINLDFADTPLTDVIAFLHDVSKINMTLDPDLVEREGPLITLKVEDMSLGNALQVIVRRFAKLDYVVRDDCLHIVGPKDEPGGHEIVQCSEAGLATLTELVQASEAKIDFDIDSVPLDEAVELLRQKCPKGIHLILDIRTVRRPYPALTLRARKAAILDVLSVLAEQAGLRPVFFDGLVLLAARGAARRRGEAGDVMHVRGPLRSRIHLRASASSGRRRILEKLDDRISLDFADTPVTDVVAFLHDTSGINMMLDPDAVEDEGPLITLKVEEMRLRKALDIILKRFAMLDYVVRDDGLFIASKGAFAGHLPDLTGAYADEDVLAAQEVEKKLDKRITVEFADLPLAKAIHQLADMLDVNVALEAATMPADSLPRITLKAKDLKGSDAFALVLYFAELESAFVHRMLYVYSPAARRRYLRGGARSGNGFVVRPHGLVVTNADLVKGATEITVCADGKTHHRAELATLDSASVWALLRLPSAPPNWLPEAKEAPQAKR